MSDTTKKTRKRPDFTAYFAPDRDNAPWTAIGAAWEHADGEGFNVRLDLVPHTAGKIVLRRPKTEAGESAP